MLYLQQVQLSWIQVLAFADVYSSSVPAFTFQSVWSPETCCCQRTRTTGDVRPRTKTGVDVSTIGLKLEQCENDGRRQMTEESCLRLGSKPFWFSLDQNDGVKLAAHGWSRWRWCYGVDMCSCHRNWFCWDTWRSSAKVMLSVLQTLVTCTLIFLTDGTEVNVTFINSLTGS